MASDWPSVVLHWVAVAALSILISLLAMRALALVPDDRLLHRPIEVCVGSATAGPVWAVGCREEGWIRG